MLKSRTLAQSLIEEGHVRVDGKRIARTSEEIRIGSIIALPLHGKVRIIRILSMPDRRGPASEARTCYEELAEQGDSANVSQQGGAN